MKNEDFNTKLSSRFESIRPAILEVLSQLFKQVFTIDHSVIGTGEPQTDIQNDSYPKLSIRFTTTGAASNVLHILTLPEDLTLNLYAWMVDGVPEEAVTENHLEGLKEGSDQILGQLRAVLDGEEMAFEVDDPHVTWIDDSASLDLTGAPAGGSALSYSLETAGNTYIVNHYLFTDHLDSDELEPREGLSDEDIDNMLNGEDLDERISVDADLGVDDVGVQQVQFGGFDGTSGVSGNGKPRNIDMLLDVDLEVLVELGRKNMLIKDVLKLGKGSVVELDKAAGEPLGIFVNGRRLAEGEVVVVDDHFGIRITKLAGTAERIKSLG